MIDVSQIDDSTVYTVSIKKPIKVGVVNMLPRDKHEMTGAFLKSVIEEFSIDVIRSADPR